MAKPVPAHITLKNGSWVTYRRDNVSYNPGAGKCIAGFEWTGDENGNIRIYTCDIKVVDANYREISGATISNRNNNPEKTIRKLLFVFRGR